MKKFSLLLCTAIVLLAGCKKSVNNETVPANPSDAQINARVLTEQLVFPWEILWGPDSKLWITERGGKISKVDPSTGQISPLLTISEVVSQGEGGLLGMVLHPDFASTPQVFVAYDYLNNGVYTEKIVRFTYTGSALTSPIVLLDGISAANNHNGCRLAISPDKKLYITTGDATNSSRSQDKTNLSGKILRINLDGSIPSDNPTPGSPVWTFGHRNPQGLVFVGNTLYSSEHGNTTDDEINVIQKGRNYGWPNVEGACNTTAELGFCPINNVAEPIYSWTPTIAPSGIDYYGSDAIPQWKNSLLLAVLKDTELLQLKLSGAGDKIESVNTYYKTTYGRMRDVAVSPDGKVYVITSNGSADKIIELSKK
ncbi:PQQ-dependent sugar dehydrogenase [Mucilaginibacter ginkgonis]|uniref:PQQ-dependent sugar dehydrogenase n=1 Tax=Mucilaginibacter ginkgonis TaxID=2682091 RepID=A0A6I4INH9_9SPHI|nr:PQQ-dependent sugar dehydrogenase [Mucilaginibacter ginkgonis]QQL48634.1 PQQ-dependent sugar dehydrogenase [Mucilaginibacter ginkgonis]